MVPAAVVAMSLLLSVMFMSPSIYTSNQQTRNRRGSVFFYALVKSRQCFDLSVQWSRSERIGGNSDGFGHRERRWFVLTSQNRNAEGRGRYEQPLTDRS